MVILVLWNYRREKYHRFIELIDIADVENNRDSPEFQYPRATYVVTV